MDSNGTGGLVQIDKLTDEYFHSWQLKVVLILSLKEFEVFLTPHPLPNDSKEPKLWQRQDGKAMALVDLSLSEIHLSHTKGATTAHGIWKRIINMHEQHTILNQLAARRNVCNATMKSHESILSFANRVRHLAGILPSMGVVMGDA